MIVTINQFCGSKFINMVIGQQRFVTAGRESMNGVAGKFFFHTANKEDVKICLW